MTQDHYPTGPFLSQRPDLGQFDVLREDFLLDFTPGTARAYKADLQDFYEWSVDAGVEVLTSTTSDLEAYLRSLSARGYAPGTIRRRASALRGFFRRLVERGLRDQSPATHMSVSNFS